MKTPGHIRLSWNMIFAGSSSWFVSRSSFGWRKYRWSDEACFCFSRAAKSLHDELIWTSFTHCLTLGKYIERWCHRVVCLCECVNNWHQISEMCTISEANSCLTLRLEEQEALSCCSEFIHRNTTPYSLCFLLTNIRNAIRCAVTLARYLLSALLDNLAIALITVLLLLIRPPLSDVTEMSPWWFCASITESHPCINLMWICVVVGGSCSLHSWRFTVCQEKKNSLLSLFTLYTHTHTYTHRHTWWVKQLWVFLGQPGRGWREARGRAQGFWI